MKNYEYKKMCFSVLAITVAETKQSQRDFLMRKKKKICRKKIYKTGVSHLRWFS